MKLYNHYYKIHNNSKLIILMDEEITNDNNMQLLLDDLKALSSKTNIEYIIKSRIKNNIELTDDDLKSDNKKKLILFNKKWLLWEDWYRINSIDIASKKYQERVNDILKNNNDATLNGFLLKAKTLIKSWKIDRAHIIPFKSKNLIYELLSIDWVGTIIGKWFWKPEIRQGEKKDILIIKSLLDSNIKKGFLKPRNISYLRSAYQNFYVAYIDNIPVWCVEIIPINQNIIELGALSIIENFLSYKIWLWLIQFVENYANKNKKILISVTNNPKLQEIYLNNNYILDETWKYLFRSIKSPGKNLYYKECS